MYDSSTSNMFTINNNQSGFIGQTFEQLNEINNFEEWIKCWDGIVASQLRNDVDSGFKSIMNELEEGISKPKTFYQEPMVPMLPMLMTQSIDSCFEDAEKVCTKIPEDAYKRVEHNGKSMYHCNWENCERKFTRRSANCRAHWLKHKKMASFVCLTCSLGFKRSVDLVGHKLTYHYPV
jgi:hypothetical protein